MLGAERLHNGGETRRQASKVQVDAVCLESLGCVSDASDEGSYREVREHIELRKFC